MFPPVSTLTLMLASWSLSPAGAGSITFVKALLWPVIMSPMMISSGLASVAVSVLRMIPCIVISSCALSSVPTSIASVLLWCPDCLLGVPGRVPCCPLCDSSVLGGGLPLWHLGFQWPILLHFMHFESLAGQ